MKERGELIRQELPLKLRLLLPLLSNVFDDIFDDLAVEGRDGIGRKTEAPWVRIFSKAMSPSPREGYYLVFHFAADGSAFYITVGCGSTIWSGGDLRAVPDQELEQRTSWAREVVSSKLGELDSFQAEMKLGAKAPLPRTFEKATVLARKVLLTELSSIQLEEILKQAATALNEIYIAQIDRRDVSQGEQDASALNKIIKPLAERRKGQGRGLNAQERKAVELRAMSVTTEHFITLGYSCQDTSANQPFDLLISRNGLSTKVEVKGTSSDFSDSILMTKNEVRLHQEEKGHTSLAIVSQIKLDRGSNPVTAHGGILELLESWDIDEWKLEAIAYQLTKNN